MQGAGCVLKLWGLQTAGFLTRRALRTHGSRLRHYTFISHQPVGELVRWKCDATNALSDRPSFLREKQGREKDRCNVSTEASKGCNWASWSVTMQEGVCCCEKHRWLYIALPAAQWSGLSQWKPAGWGPNSEHHRQKMSQPCWSQPSWPLLSFYNLRLPVICQKQRGWNRKRTSIQCFPKVHTTGEHAKHRGKDSDTCCIWLLPCHPKQKTWCYSPGSWPSKKQKTNKTQTIWLMNAFPKRSLLREACLRIIHPDWFVPRAAQKIPNR